MGADLQIAGVCAEERRDLEGRAGSGALGGALGRLAGAWQSRRGAERAHRCGTLHCSWCRTVGPEGWGTEKVSARHTVRNHTKIGVALGCARRALGDHVGALGRCAGTGHGAVVYAGR